MSKMERDKTARNKTTWSFNALDTWFFRESRPHGALGGTELASLFPPPARTLAGAIRYLMGEKVGVDWQEFGARRGTVGDLDLIAEIGFGNDLGKLRLEGPWLVQNSNERHRLFPAPGFLMARPKIDASKPDPDDISREVLRLFLGPVTHSDLGRVRLPVLPKAAAVRAKALDNAWLTRAGLERVLAGGLPRVSEVVDLASLFREEPRLGIARNNASRTNLESMLYQTRHIRPAADLAIEVDVAGVNSRLLDPLPWVRLGGEGRLAAVHGRADLPTFPQAPEPTAETRGLILCLLTPADFGRHWLPDGFTPGNRIDGVQGQRGDSWVGTLHGIELEIHSAIVGKALREGGWDLARRRPRAVRSLIPAGSAWYCTVRNCALKEAIRVLHGAAIGRKESLALGRGKCAVALWNASEDLKGDH